MRKFIVIAASVVLLVGVISGGTVLADKPGPSAASGAVLMQSQEGTLLVYPNPAGNSNNETEIQSYPAVRHVSLTLGFSSVGSGDPGYNTVTVLTGDGAVFWKQNWDPSTDPLLVTIDFNAKEWYITGHQYQSARLAVVVYSYVVTYPAL